MIGHPPTQAQKEIITQQLGREPRGLISVAVATPEGVPVVLQMASMVDGQPFPTLYWLSSKDVYQAIAEIETSGEVKRLEQALLDDESFLNEHLADQARYVALRDEQMSAAVRAEIEQRGFEDLFKTYGIGGIRQWDKIRCLHMNYAYHLVHSTAVGRRLEQAFDLAKLTITK